MTVTPNPACLDEPIMVTGTGFMPGGPLFFWWDLKNPNQNLIGGNVYAQLPGADYTGGFTLKLDSLPTAVYPADAGDHTLTVATYGGGYFGMDLVPITTTVRILPRRGWETAPLPGAAPSGYAGGLLAYLKYSADDATTSLVLSDGNLARQVLSLAAPGGFLGEPNWSPDGSRLAFAAMADTAPFYNLYVLQRGGGLSQVTGYGGGMPRGVGAGRGTIVGTVVPAEFPEGLNAGSELETLGRCRDMLLDPRTGEPKPPAGINVGLVGTGLTTVAASKPDAEGNPGPYVFRLDNVPEGEYSLHAWYSDLICQDDVTVTAEGNSRSVVRVAGATASGTVTVRVAAGQTAQVPEVKTFYTWQQISLPSWASNDTLVYILGSGVWEHAKAASYDAWSLRLGGQPLQLSETARHGTLGMLHATPVGPKVVGTLNKLPGLFATDLVDFPGHAQILTSFPVMLPNGMSPLEGYPAWAPDGIHIAFLRRDLNIPFPSIDPQGKPMDVARASMAMSLGDVWIKNVATGEERQLTRFNIRNGEGVVGRPAWSPDRTQIAVTYTRDAVRNTDIAILNLPDGRMFALTADGRSAFPAWTSQARAADYPENLPFTLRLETPPAALAGDVDGDGKVDIRDALRCLRFVANLAAPTPQERQAADLNHDTNLDIRDVISLLRKLVQATG